MVVSFLITDRVTQLLSILTVIGDLILILLLIGIIYKIVLKKDIGFLNKLKDIISKKGLLFAFVISVIATGGSLFYSELAGYTPCRLCWYQRILMYPQALLFCIAFFKKDRSIFSYAIPMCIIGSLISIYHYIVQLASIETSCVEGGVSCTSKYIFHFGYITIPMMALTAFLLIIGISIILKTRGEK